MRNKVTHSSQTYTSYNDQRKEDESQVSSGALGSSKSSSGTQTSVAKGVGSAFDASKSLVIGLRGDTTFPVEHLVIKDIITNSRGTTCV